MRSRDLIKELEADGWVLVKVSGSHHKFKHPTKKGTPVVPHPKGELGKGLVKQIRRIAEL